MSPVSTKDRPSWTESGSDLAEALSPEVRLARGPQRPAHDPGIGRLRRAWPGRLAWPVLVALALVGPGLGLVVHGSLTERARERLEAALETELFQHAKALSDQVLSFEEAVQAVRGLFEASDLVRRDEFALFTQQMLERHPAVSLIAWAPSVPRGERTAFEQQARLDGVPSYRVHTASDAPPAAPSAADHYPVLFAEPALQHADMPGLDLVADLLRGRLLSRALATGQPVLSDPLQLSPGEPEGSGALLALVVRRSTTANAEPAPQGLLLLGFHFTALQSHAAAQLGARAASLSTSLLDADVDGRVASLGLHDEGASSEPPGLSAEHVLHVAGQRWRLHGTPSTKFVEQQRGTNPLLVASATLLGWEVLLAAVLALVVGWHGQAMRRQSTLVSNVLHNLGEGVVVADRHGSVRLANEAAVRLAGAPVDDAGTPQWPRRLALHLPNSGALCPHAQLPMTRAVAGQTVAEELYELRQPYASEALDVAVSARPIFDERGALHGGVIVMRDVTEQLRLQKKAVSLELAGEVQRRLFPSAPPARLGLDLAGTVLPAEETSGDYYDWMRQADGRLLLAIGDVSDHGLPSAMMMASTRAYVRSQAAAGEAPDAILARVNAALTRELPPDKFVTLLCVEVDPATRRMRFASAGHPAALLLGPEGEIEARLEPTGPLLGVLEDARYRLEEAPPLLPGRMLVLLTDGALECPDPRGRLFEEQRLLEVLRAHRARPAAAIVAAVGGRPPGVRRRERPARRRHAGGPQGLGAWALLRPPPQATMEAGGSREPRWERVAASPRSHADLRRAEGGSRAPEPGPPGCAAGDGAAGTPAAAPHPGNR